MVDYYEETVENLANQEFNLTRIPLRQKMDDRNSREIYSNISNKKSNIKTEKKSEFAKYRKLLGLIFLLTFIFGILNYRTALINTKLTEKEKAKSKLEEIQKENVQLQVNIEQSLNISNVEKIAKEKLGMQKLDNSQRTYINISKKDFVETPLNSGLKAKQSWIEKFMNLIRGK